MQQIIPPEDNDETAPNTRRRSPQLRVHTPNTYAQAAHMLVQKELHPFHTNLVLHPETGKSMSYVESITNPLTKERWTNAACKELGRLAQGWEGKKGTDTIEFLRKEKIKGIPKDRTITYARFVVDFRSQKKDPYRVCITVGGNLIMYPGEVATTTADITTSKILWNSVLSTKNAKYICVDIKDFYLQTPMGWYEYMRIPVDRIPEIFLSAYKLHDKIYNGYVYVCTK
eukprot:14358062-Ditylum_brightwellii.AAC.1